MSFWFVVFVVALIGLAGVALLDRAIAAWERRERSKVEQLRAKAERQRIVGVLEHSGTEPVPDGGNDADRLHAQFQKDWPIFRGNTEGSSVYQTRAKYRL